MIHITDKPQCCGCNACVQACPKQCIQMYEDDEGFLYPRVDTTRCIDCGKCEKVCPVINQAAPQRPLKVYAAIHPDEAVRHQSSSGGIFTLLAEQTIKDGGVVFGARFDDEWQVVHDYTDTLAGLSAFRGSKYVQSRIGNTYRQAEDFLKQGRKVLFTGTPCQIAGLKRYLHKEYDNLLAVEVICHGAPSPLIWKKHLQEVSQGERITNINFRDKVSGWKTYSITVQGNQGNIHQTPYPKDSFMRGFLSDIYLRPSCYACPAKSGKSGADITLGDFWGIDKISPSIDDNNGCSLVMTISPTALTYCQQAKLLSEASYEQALSYNPSIEHSVSIPTNRKFFFYLIKKGRNLHKAINAYFSTSLLNRTRRLFFRKIHL